MKVDRGPAITRFRDRVPIHTRKPFRQLLLVSYILNDCALYCDSAKNIIARWKEMLKHFLEIMLLLCILDGRQRDGLAVLNETLQLHVIN